MKEIKLNYAGLGRYADVSPFVMSDGRLPLKVALPAYNGEFFLIAENNGEVTKHTLDGSGEITLRNLTAGELRTEIKHYLKGVLVKSYKVEPLILIDADGTLYAQPEIVALEAKCSELFAALTETRDMLRRTADELKETRAALDAVNAELAKQGERVDKLVNFAYSDYRENVYLGGGSAQDFEKEYGLIPEENKGDENNET